MRESDTPASTPYLAQYGTDECLFRRHEQGSPADLRHGTGHEVGVDEMHRDAFISQLRGERVGPLLEKSLASAVGCE